MSQRRKNEHELLETRKVREEKEKVRQENYTKNKEKMDQELLDLGYRLKLIQNKRQQLEEAQKMEKIEQIKKKREMYLSKSLSHKEELAQHQKERRAKILQYETIYMNRVISKEQKNNQFRINAGLKVIQNQISLHKSLNSFFKKVNQLKSEAIFKWTPAQKRKEYLAIRRDILQKEEEEREKEKEKSV